MGTTARDANTGKPVRGWCGVRHQPRQRAPTCCRARSCSGGLSRGPNRPKQAAGDQTRIRAVAVAPVTASGKGGGEEVPVGHQEFAVPKGADAICESRDPFGALRAAESSHGGRRRIRPVAPALGGLHPSPIPRCDGSDSQTANRNSQLPTGVSKATGAALRCEHPLNHTHTHAQIHDTNPQHGFSGGFQPRAANDLAPVTDSWLEVASPPQTGPRTNSCWRLPLQSVFWLLYQSGEADETGGAQGRGVRQQSFHARYLALAGARGWFSETSVLGAGASQIQRQAGCITPTLPSGVGDGAGW